MNKRGLLSSKNQIYQLLGFELISLTVISFIFYFFQAFDAIASFWIGGFISILFNLYQGTTLFKENYASAASRIVKRFYRTEFTKFIAISLLFICLMKMTHLNLLSFVLGYLLSEVGLWIVLAVIMKLPMFYLNTRGLNFNE